MIREMEIGKPFFTVSYIENEDDVRVNEASIIINIAYREKKDLLVAGQPIHPVHATVLQNVTIPHVDAALLVEGYGAAAADEKIFDKITEAWPRMYDLRPEERFKNIPFHKCNADGKVNDYISITCVCMNGAFPCGYHNTHKDNIDEYHCQILGYGKMEHCFENNPDTKFRIMNTAPGTVHDQLYDEDGNYAWHQFEAITPSVFMGILILRD